MAPDELIVRKKNWGTADRSLYKLDHELGPGICPSEEDCSSEGHGNCEFFCKLPSHCLTRRLAVLYLTTRELPKSAVALTVRSQADKV